MINFTDSMNEQFKQFADLQAQSFAPMRSFVAAATETAEKMARHNHAVASDVLEFTTKQANVSMSNDNMNDAASAQMVNTKSFVELMTSRATEYNEMAQQFGGQVKEATDTASVSASFK